MAPFRRCIAGRGFQADERQSLRGRRILVVDADDSVRSAAHNLLECYGCVVETWPTTAARRCAWSAAWPWKESYDVIIADIRLPDLSGFDLLVKLQASLDSVPLVLMTGFGYDLRGIDRESPAGRLAVLGCSLQAVSPRSAARLTVEKMVEAPLTRFPMSWTGGGCDLGDCGFRVVALGGLAGHSMFWIGLGQSAARDRHSRQDASIRPIWD